MKIAVVGCGAVGSFYGASLARVGGDVHFLLRSDYEVVRRQGVFIRSPNGDFRVRPKCARSPEEIGPVDLIVIGLKSTTNAEFAKLLPPLVGSQTAILTLQNGLGNEEQLARLFPVEQILGGLCFVCLNRLEPGLVHHIAHGRVVLGEFQRPPEPRTHDIAQWFVNAGVPCSLTDNLARAHWEKLVWNIPFNGLGVGGTAGLEAVIRGHRPDTGPLEACLTTDKLLADSRWCNLLRELMNEVITAARGLGLPVSEALADKHVERTRSMGAYKASTLIDFERHLPLELESMFLEPLRQARKVKLKAPRLEALCRLLEQLDIGNRASRPDEQRILSPS
jgi:2-dehydropantoate 2-reductase